MSGATVIIDAENVRRSTWPNVDRERLVELCERWARERDMHVVVVFDGPAPAVEATVELVGTSGESADDWIARHARERTPFWLVTSDRELRERAGGTADRTIGGGSFVRELTKRSAAE